MLEAARWAPSPHNSQPWSFIVVKDRKTIEELLEISYYGAFYSEPSLIIAIVLEPIFEDQKALLRGSAKNFVQSHRYMTISIPAINITYEAASLGIGSCLLSLLTEKAGKILNMPEGREAVLAVGLGYEKSGTFQKKRERKGLERIVHYERYGGKE